MAGCQGGSSGTGDSETGGVTGGDTSTSESQPTTGGDVSRAECEAYLACIAATMPEALPAAQAGYGEDGLCWKGSASEIENCLTACEVGREKNHELFPEEEACFLCTTNEDCSVGETCFKGSCAMGCGDGRVEGNEICDSEESCDEDCLGPLDCTPLGNVGCQPGFTCTLVVVPNGDTVFGECYDFVESAPGRGEVCENRCEGGLFCAPADSLAACPGDACCTDWCDLGAPEICPQGTVCTKWEFSVDIHPSLAYLGVCISS